MSLTIAYLAEGKLFLSSGANKPVPIESAFAQEMIEDLRKRQEKNEWKTRSATGQIMAGNGPFGAGATDPAARRIHISGITRGEQAGELIYALDTDLVGGLFRYDTGARSEQRLFHRNKFRARHLSRHPHSSLVAFSQQGEDGVANIALMDVEGKELQTVTEGDSLDESPSWVGGSAQKLVFQSAGIGRNQEGHMAGIGPYAIQMLDLDKEDLTILLEDETKDFLLPQMTREGDLYFIRRPYQRAARLSPFSVLKDILLLPFRLVWALIAFLNFFSQVFAGKPLTTAGGPKREGPTPRYLMLWGKVIDAEKAEKAVKKGELAALVPDDWELVHRTAAGEETVLARGVLSYDLCTDGGVVYTNGSAVFHRPPNGEPQQLCTGRMIEHVLVAG